MSDEDPPDLPDIEGLRVIARQRVDHFTRLRDAAQAEIDKAQEYLSGVRATAKASQYGTAVSDNLYRRVMESLGNHEYAGVRTVANAASVSTSHTNRALGIAVERGHATLEMRPRNKYRYRLTTAGLEYLTTEVKAVVIRCPDCGARMPSLIVTLVVGRERREVLSTSCRICAQLELDLGEDRYMKAWENGTPIKETSA